MIGTFFGFQGGKFMTSRFTGYPVAEFIIGFFLTTLEVFL